MPEASSAPRSLLNLQRADSIVPRLTPWLIDGWLVEDTLAGLVAASGTCKSFLAIDWACCVATGRPWNGLAVKRGPVCYLAGEGQHGLRKRIAAWEAANSQTIDGAPLYLSAGLPFLCDDLNASRAIDEMQAATFTAGPSLIVVDTVARAMGGANENAAEDVSRFIRALDWCRQECSATVLTIHHTGNDPGNQGRARGSSAYKAALDSEFLLKPVGLNIELSGSKCKDWAPPQPMRFQKRVVPIDVGGQGDSSLVLRHLTDAAVEADKRPEVMRLREEGHTHRQIVELTGVSKGTVGRWLSPSGCPAPPGITYRGGGADTPHGAETAGQGWGKWGNGHEYINTSEGDQ